MNLKLRIDHMKAVIIPTLHLVHPIHLLKKIGTVLREFRLEKGSGETNDCAFETVRCEIRHLTGEKIGKSTVESFYYGKGDPKFRTVMSIMRWVDSKEIASLDNNNNARFGPYIGNWPGREEERCYQAKAKFQVNFIIFVEKAVWEISSSPEK
ncbi:hypothetical protein C1646_740431, partial [Rhizophagus diaphanus]